MKVTLHFKSNSSLSNLFIFMYIQLIFRFRIEILNKYILSIHV